MTPEQARAELARRELARRQSTVEPEDNENLLQKVVRYGLKDPAIGVLNMGREFANLPSKLSGGRIPEFSPSNFNFGETLGVEEPSGLDRLIQGVGQYGPAMAIPGVGLGRAGQAITKIPGIGKFASRAISEAIPQGLYGAAQAPQDNLKAGAESAGMMAPLSVINQLMESTSPKVKAMAKLAGFGTGALLGREGAKTAGFGELGSDVIGSFLGALGARHMDSTKERNLRLAKGADNPLATQKLEAANRLGLDYLTPAEAGESQIAAGRQGSLGKTEEGEYLLHQKLKGREASERHAIEKTLDQIYSPGKMDKQVTEAYKAINEVDLPQEFPLQYKDNAIISEAKNAVENTPAYKESLKSLMPNKNAKLSENEDFVPYDHSGMFGVDYKKNDKGINANLDMKKEGDAARVINSHVGEDHRGQGIGKQLYKKAIDEALKRGLKFESDSSVSHDAMRVYKALEKEGYKFEYNPDLLEKEPGVTYDAVGTADMESPVVKLISTPQSEPTSLVYWDHVKRALDDMVSKAERAGNNNEARIISNTRREMRDQMDEAFPEYANARALYERKMVRQGLEKVFDRKEITGSNFYQALASQKKFDEVIKHLKNAPEAAQNLKDMRLVFNNLLGSRTIKTAKGKTEYGMNQMRSSGAFLESLIENVFTKGGNDKAAIEFITSKDWPKQLKEINKISDKHMKMVAFALALSKGVSQAAGQQERKPLEINMVGGHR